MGFNSEFKELNHWCCSKNNLAIISLPDNIIKHSRLKILRQQLEEIKE